MTARTPVMAARNCLCFMGRFLEGGLLVAGYPRLETNQSLQLEIG